MSKLRLAKAALFDIDGTILRGSVDGNFPKYLTSIGLIEEKDIERTRRIQMELRKAYNRQFAFEMSTWLYAMNIRGLQREEIEAAAKKFMEKYIRENMFPYVPSLIQELRKLVDVIIAIGGPPQECANEIKTLGFDRVYGTVLEVHGGVYTGRVIRDCSLERDKEQTVDLAALEYNIDLTQSLGFGDTDHDEPILRRVGFPIAMNPNKQLLAICAERSWPAFSEENPLTPDMLVKLFKTQLI